MQNVESWQETKFTLKKGKLRASLKGTAKGSLFMADLIAEKIQTALDENAKGILVDLGCGYVPFYGYYKSKIDQSICMDWQNSLHKNQHLDIEQDLTKPLKLEDNVADTLLLSDVLEHIPTPQLLMDEMTRVLKPGGKLILNVPFAYWEHEAPHDYHRYTQHMLKLMAEKSGLDVLKLEPIGDGFGVIGDILAKALMRMPILNLLPITYNAFNKWRYRKGIYVMKQLPLAYIMICEKPEIR